jgi:hypothetical protein
MPRREAPVSARRLVVLLSSLVILLPACDRSRPKIDRNGDGAEALAVTRQATNGDYLWFFQDSPTPALFGNYYGYDRIVPGDYDGDGRIDPAVIRSRNCASDPRDDYRWLVELSSGGNLDVAFGSCEGGSPEYGFDRPVPADYDGDGVTDIAVYRPGTPSDPAGTWFVRLSSGGFITTEFGSGYDEPMPADFDCDGRADLAIRRGKGQLDADLEFIVTGSSTHEVTHRIFGRGAHFDEDGDLVLGDEYVPGDVDGDGCADLTVVRYSGFGTFLWYSWASTIGYRTIEWGNSGDTPIHGDFNGDGIDDIPAVARSVNGHFVLFARDGATAALITSPPFGDNFLIPDQLLNVQGQLPGS